MRAVIQRVTRASVTVEGDRVAEIGDGLLILLGIGPDDTEEKKMKGCIKQDIREYLDNRGDLISIDKQDNGAYEIWIKDNAECFCYMFFDYSNAIIDY